MATQQNLVIKNVKASSILTGSYVAGTVIGADGQNIGEMNQLVLLISATIGSLTTIDIKIEYSYDNTTYFQESAQSIAAGVDTLSELVHKINGTKNIALPVQIKAPYIKVSAIGSGGAATNSLLKIDALVGVA